MRPKISAAEWEVMNIVWAKQSATALQVFDALPARHGWKQKTVNTFLTRLVAKGVAAASKDGKAFVYVPKIAREECIRREGDSFLHRVFQGAVGDLVLHFCENADLSPEEIRELERLLKVKKTKR
jgi:BlaI family transcriptional regulator, penicillinase repressor